MSQENVEIVLAVHEIEDDIAAAARDDDLWAAWKERAAPHFQADFVGHLATGGNLSTGHRRDYRSR